MLRIPTHRVAEHPGALLREQINDMGLTVDSVAVAAGLDSAHLREIVDERREVSAQEARALGAYFGQSPEFWENAQKVYNLSSHRLEAKRQRPAASASAIDDTLTDEGIPSELDFEGTDFGARAISPFREMGAYEALWSRPNTTFKSLSEHFAKRIGSVPSDFVSSEEAFECAHFVKHLFEKANVGSFGVRVHGAGEYPEKLRDARYPVQLLYYQGWWDLAAAQRSIAVVGSRTPSRDGLARARRLVRELVDDEFTVVSGLAAGIDRVAHETAIAENGRTIAVIGTPLSRAYPKENRDLQREISRRFLLISQVPVKRYESQHYRINRLFFPERNITMSALTEATVIVEAGETSGTLTQARAALSQGRKLFILDSCFQNSRLTWPAKFAAQGAIRVKSYDDIEKHLPATSN